MDDRKIAKELVRLAEELVSRGRSGRVEDRELLKIMEDVVEDVAVDAVEGTGESLNVRVERKRNSVEAVGIIPISWLVSTGYSPPGNVDKKLEKYVNDRYEGMSDEMRKSFPALADTNGVITYNDAEEAGLESEYEDWETALWDEGEIVIVDAGGLLLSEKCRAYAGVTIGDGKSRYDWLEYDEFSYEDAEDFRKKFEKSLRKVVAKL